MDSPRNFRYFLAGDVVRPWARAKMIDVESGPVAGGPLTGALERDFCTHLLSVPMWIALASFVLLLVLRPNGRRPVVSTAKRT
ncbi:MAG: hypothetical protein EXS13_12050 [Planctomycetes bacterium]|nr:hypothetical protein [Planctomycetota bacterium]